MEHLASTSFDRSLGFEDGVATLRSDLLYQTRKSANRWLFLTQSPEYPYYRIEKNQLEDLLRIRALQGLSKFRQAVCLGAADGSKEMMIGRRATRNGCGLEFVLIDSSPALLDHALERFSSLDEFQARGELLDVRDTVALRETMKKSSFSPSTPRLFTAFGNIVGNYKGLSLVASLQEVMKEGDRLVFGAHLKAREKGTLPYSAYHSKPYYRHMVSVLRDANIDPDSGKLRTVVCESDNGLIDVVEIILDLNRDAILSIRTNPDNQTRTHTVRHIKIDVSCKFSLAFLVSELNRLEWNGREHWISKCGRNAIFSCIR